MPLLARLLLHSCLSVKMYQSIERVKFAPPHYITSFYLQENMLKHCLAFSSLATSFGFSMQQLSVPCRCVLISPILDVNDANSLSKYLSMFQKSSRCQCGANESMSFLFAMLLQARFCRRLALAVQIFRSKPLTDVSISIKTAW